MPADTAQAVLVRAPGPGQRITPVCTAGVEPVTLPMIHLRLDGGS